MIHVYRMFLMRGVGTIEGLRANSVIYLEQSDSQNSNIPRLTPIEWFNSVIYPG